jgi:hypothetical protein
VLIAADWCIDLLIKREIQALNMLYVGSKLIYASDHIYARYFREAREAIYFSENSHTEFRISVSYL